jgi:hypothetical protein
LNGQYRDIGPTVRRHVKIEATDIHYIGKEANELDEQVFLGFDPEAQPEYGIEGEAYVELLAQARQAVDKYKPPAISEITGISTRHLRNIRNGASNATMATLKIIEFAIPAIKVRQAEVQSHNQQLLEWARDEGDRIGVRELARRLRTDPANLAKALAGRRCPSRALLALMARTRSDQDG